MILKTYRQGLHQAAKVFLLPFFSLDVGDLHGITGSSQKKHVGTFQQIKLNLYSFTVLEINLTKEKDGQLTKIYIDFIQRKKHLCRLQRTISCCVSVPHEKP